MRKLIASEWVSLDGVFDAANMDTWFRPFDSEPRQAYIRERLYSADALLLGRVTYEMLSGYWSKLRNNEMGIADRINAMPKVVASRSLRRADWNATVLEGNLAEAIVELKRQPGREITLLGSADLARSLMKARLIDEVWLLVQPVVAGSGKRFFQDGAAMTRLSLVATSTLPSGVLAMRYELAS